MGIKTSHILSSFGFNTPDYLYLDGYDLKRSNSKKK